MSNTAITMPGGPASKRKASAEEEPAPAPQSPLLKLTIPHAYALIPQPGRPGRFYAVHLANVTADQLDHLEPSGRSEAATFGMQRIERAMDRRHREKLWAK